MMGNVFFFQINVLVNKSNWLCEYLVLKNVVIKRANVFDIKPYILKYVTKPLIFAFYNGSHCIGDKKCKFFRKICYRKQFLKNHVISHIEAENFVLVKLPGAIYIRVKYFVCTISA